MPSVGDNGVINDVWGEFHSGQRLRSVAPGIHLLFNDAVVDISPSVEEGLINDKEGRILSGVDLSRITPKYFLQCGRARLAIVKELVGLLRIRNGKSALQLIDGKDSEWKAASEFLA